MRYFITVESLWFFRKRWKVYELGHTDGDETWLASFANKYDATEYVRRVLYSEPEVK